MANYSEIKAAIAEVIKANGNEEITGNILQDVLLSMVSNLGTYYQFAGIATPGTNPGTPDQNVFYIAGAGTYPNFGGYSIPKNNFGVLKWDGSWNTEYIDIFSIAPALYGLYAGYIFMYAIGTAEAQLKQVANDCASAQNNRFYIATIPGYNLRLLSDDGTIDVTFDVTSTAVFILCNASEEGNKVTILNSGLALYNPLVARLNQMQQQIDMLIAGGGGGGGGGATAVGIDLVNDTAEEIYAKVYANINAGAVFVGSNYSTGDRFVIFPTMEGNSVNLYYFEQGKYLTNVRVTKSGDQYSKSTNNAEYTLD